MYESVVDGEHIAFSTDELVGTLSTTLFSTDFIGLTNIIVATDITEVLGNETVIDVFDVHVCWVDHPSAYVLLFLLFSLNVRREPIVSQVTHSRV